MLQAPGKLLAPLIDALEDKVGADAHGLLASYQREVHAALTDGGGGGGAPALREGIDAVRRLALSPSKGGGGGGGERVSASAADEAAEGDGGADAAAEAKAAAPKKKKRPPKAS